MLQIFQSSVGCANSCAMCSQWASSWVTRLTRNSLSRVLGWLKKVVEVKNWERWPLLGQNRSHKPWIIFPYLDTDVGSDPNLGYLVEILWKNFGCKTRISTVGFSRHNKALQEMHKDIASRLRQLIEGFRISLTPYTENFFSEDYPLDIVNLLDIYLPLIGDRWVWRDVFACELRFPPFIQLWDVEIWIFWWRFFIRSSDYCFIADNEWSVPESKISHIESTKVQFDRPGIIWKIYSWNGLSVRKLEELIITEDYQEAQLYYLKNVDWDLFAVNPLVSEMWFHALHFLPKTLTRKQAGVINSTRPFMNAMIEYKKLKGIDWRSKLKWWNIDDFLIFFRNYIQIHAHPDILRNFWTDQIFPVILVASEIIKRSRIDDDVFFDPGFLVDTWHIVNQWRAKGIFCGLVSRSDEPITVNEMKGYADRNSIWTSRGIIYRLSPVVSSGVGGLRNIVRGGSGLVLSGLHHKWLQPIPEKTHLISADIETEFTPKSKIIWEFGLPWLPIIS